MPAKSKAQRRFMAFCEHSDNPPARCPDMTKEQLHDFAATKEKGLPLKKRDKEDLQNGYRKRY